MQGYLNSGIYETTINKVDALINTYVKTATAFYTHEEYQDSLPVLLQFGKDGAASITAQLAGQQPSDTYGTIPTTVDLKALGSMGGGGQPPGFGDNAQQDGNEQEGMPGGSSMPDRETMSKARNTEQHQRRRIDGRADQRA